MIRKLLFVLFAVSATTASAAHSLIAAYNETSQPAGGVYWPYSIGWLWEAPVSFQLTRVETFFAFGDKTVGIEVYDGLPHEGGQLMASAEYNAVGGTWGGANLGAVSLSAGERYLFGFTNVDGLGLSFTEEFGSTLFSADGFVRYDSDSNSPASYDLSYFGQANAKLRIYGVPEPSSFVLMSIVISALIRRSPRGE